MSVIGLTFGTAAKASARARRTPRASRRRRPDSRGGRERSYQQNASASETSTSAKETSCQLNVAPPAPRPRAGAPPEASPPAAALPPARGAARRRAPSRMRAVSVAKYQPPASISVDRPVGDHPSVGEQHRARRRRRRRTRRRAWRRPRRVLRPPVLPATARDAAWRPGPCPAWARRGEHRRAARSPPSTIASARRWRSPAGEVARMALAEAGEPGDGERRGRRLLLDALVQEVVARVLQQQRDPPAALDAAAGRLHQAGGVAQQRRLAGAVAAHQRDRARPAASVESDAAQDRRPVAQLMPDAPHVERRHGRLAARPSSLLARLRQRPTPGRCCGAAPRRPLRRAGRARAASRAPA